MSHHGLPIGRRRRWSPPRLQTDAPVSERHATWLELFFDLVFVVVVAGLAHLLHDDLTVRGLLIYAALFVPIWWQWIDFSYYGDQYDTDDLSYRAFIIAAMLGIIVLALTIPEVRHGDADQFALAYIALRLLIIALYWRVWRHEPRARELAGRYTLSFTIALAPWLLSLAVPEPAKYALWAVALLIEIGNGPVTYATIRQVPQQESHMDERFGLFVIIVLGEAVVAVVTGLDDTDWQRSATVTGVAGFGVAVALWWLYFGKADASTINRALRGTRLDLLRSYLYGYSHVLVFAGITAIGVAIEGAIDAASHDEHGMDISIVLGISVLAYLIGLTVLQWAASGELPRVVVLARCAVVAVVGALLALAQSVSAPVFVIVLAITLIALVIVEESTIALPDTPQDEESAALPGRP